MGGYFGCLNYGKSLMKIKNEFFFFIKNEFSFSKTKLIYALKITIAASIGGAIAFYLSYYKQIGLGWWIGSSIFAIPSITESITFIDKYNNICYHHLCWG